ncbi:unnamed protein product [Pieris macdunnoughi]|uniref:Uncharacterized protein n=1 Tax=Pieris macdunnoughi TaxID=345717 RepID=A0A821S681_9NEOP|nr:unnamed protein product [Pieris macdunnoughi]
MSMHQSKQHQKRIRKEHAVNNRNGRKGYPDILRNAISIPDKIPIFYWKIVRADLQRQWTPDLALILNTA